MLIYKSNIFGWLHSLPTLVPLREQTCNQRCPLIATLKTEGWMALLASTHSEAPFDICSDPLSSLNPTFWSCCGNRSKNCTLFIFLINDFFLLLMMKKCHRPDETLRLLMQICKVTPFDKTLDKKYFIFHYFWFVT